MTTITGEGGAPPRLAVPDFIALSTDAETVAIAKTIGQVLWDDLNFEREFAFIPRDVYATIPTATSFADVPFDRWRELNADGLVVGTVQKIGDGVRVEMRLFNVRTRQSAFGRQYDGAAANPRLFAHTDRPTRSTSRSARCTASRRRKLTFDSDRDGERMTGHGPEPQRQGDLHLRLRRREPAARHRQQDAEHRAALVARRPLDRLHVVPARRRRTSSSRTSSRGRSTR